MLEERESEKEGQEGKQSRDQMTYEEADKGEEADEGEETEERPRDQFQNLIVARTIWQAGERWRRAVARQLKSIGLTFKEWLVLDAAWQLMLEKGDAVSQAEVARQSGLNQMAVSRSMAVLDRRGWVSRGPAMEGLAWRVWVIGQGECILREAQKRVDALGAPLQR
jgi:DNA-binding MarR family transcriptional regulator